MIDEPPYAELNAKRLASIGSSRSHPSRVSRITLTSTVYGCRQKKFLDWVLRTPKSPSRFIRSERHKDEKRINQRLSGRQASIFEIPFYKLGCLNSAALMVILSPTCVPNSFRCRLRWTGIPPHYFLCTEFESTSSVKLEYSSLSR